MPWSFLQSHNTHLVCLPSLRSGDVQHLRGRRIALRVHTLPRGHVLCRQRRVLLRGVPALRRGVFQRARRHILRVHRFHVPGGQVRKRRRRVRAVLARDGVHRGGAGRAAAVLLEREHVRGERGGGVG